MIEQIQATSQSGMAGKSGKQVKGSLFAKLLAMLDKHTETSGQHKGKGLQLETSGLVKGKSLIALSDKGDPLLAAKSKQLITQATKDKTGAKTQAEETATPLVPSATLIIDTTLQSKKPDIIEKVAVGLAGQNTNIKDGLVNPVLKQPLPAGGGLAGGKIDEAVEVRQPVELGDKLQTTQSETRLSASAGFNVEKVQTLIGDGEVQPSRQDAKANPVILMQKSAPTAGAVLNKQAAANPVEQQLMPTQTTEEQKTRHGKQTINPLAGKDGLLQKTETIQLAVGPHLQQSRTVQAPRDLNARAGLPLNNLSGEKAETIQVAVGPRLQQSKTVQAPHHLNTNPGVQIDNPTGEKVDVAASRLQQGKTIQATQTEQIKPGVQPGNLTGEKVAVTASRLLQDKTVEVLTSRLQQGKTIQVTQAEQIKPGVQLNSPTGEKVDVAASGLQQGKHARTPQNMNAAANMQLNSSPGEKVDLLHKGETPNVAAAQIQQGKTGPTPQGSNSTTTSGLSTTAASNFSHASMADSNSRSSDKGGRESHSLSALSSEAKSAGSSVNTNFQSYLSQKTNPGMSVFDSMQYIAQSAKNGQTRLEIQLEPAGLGKIQVTLQTDAVKQLQVHLIADQGTTRQAIEQQLPALRSALAQQGLDLSGFSMGSHKDGMSFGSNGQQQATPFSKDNTATLKDSNAVTPTQQATGNGSARLSIHV